MKISNFENYIEDKIVNRGQDYYESIDRENIEQIDVGEFSATIWGTDEDNVYIKLNEDNDIKEHYCNCPYDWGDVCKHKVAVLLYIRKKELYLEEGITVGQMKLVLSEVTE